MLLIAIDFIMIKFINVHLQSNCEYIVDNVNIQYKPILYMPAENILVFCSMI